MYKIVILDGGKYENVLKGNRYCFSKRKTGKFMKKLTSWGCNFEVYKFIHTTNGIWCWSDGEKCLEKLWKKYCDIEICWVGGE